MSVNVADTDPKKTPLLDQLQSFLIGGHDGLRQVLKIPNEGIALR